MIPSLVLSAECLASVLLSNLAILKASKLLRTSKLTGIDVIHGFAINAKVKVKFTLEQVTMAQKGSRGIALPFLEPQN
jgi:hypothetical protein